MNQLERLERCKHDEFLKVMIEQLEQIQEDLICILDGLDEEIIYKATELIVDRFETVLLKYEEVTKTIWERFQDVQSRSNSAD